jgi:hypothetical protein
MTSVRQISALWMTVAVGILALTTGDDSWGETRLGKSVIQLAPDPQPVPPRPTPELQPATVSRVKSRLEIKQVPEIKPKPELAPAVTPDCYWKPHYHCLVAPYDCKTAPWAPRCGYDATCDAYCGKPPPCLQPQCQKWCPDCYGPKPPVVCFPGSPCAPCGLQHR